VSAVPAVLKKSSPDHQSSKFQGVRSRELKASDSSLFLKAKIQSGQLTSQKILEHCHQLTRLKTSQASVVKTS